MRSGSLYCQLPQDVYRNVCEIGFVELDCAPWEVIRSYFDEVLPKQMTRQGTFRKALATKALMMDVLPTDRKKKDPKRKKTLSSRQKKAMGLFKLDKKNQRYEAYLPLHELWKEYMKGLLQLTPDTILKQVESKLLKADYHGCLITVKASKCESYVDLSGIVLQETKNTFNVITKRNAIKAIPKKNSLFTFELDGFSFRIIGDNFCFRPADRMAKKFKPKTCPDFDWKIGS